MIKSRPNMNKMTIILRSLMELIVTTLFNKMLEKLNFAGVIRLLDEVMILPVTIIGLLCTSL